MGISLGLLVAFLLAMFIAAWISWALVQALRKLFKRP
jgi:predicted permease